MDLKTHRRVSARLLGVGEGRVRFDPESLEDISAAVTREDLRKLVKSGAISARKVRGISRSRAKLRVAQRAKGRRSGAGKRKGTANARASRKERWMTTIRNVRKMLAELKAAKKIDGAAYRKLYLLAKGGVFKSRAHLETYLKERKIAG